MASLSDPATQDFSVVDNAMPQDAIVQSAKLEKQAPMFQQVRVEFNPGESLTHFVASNNNVVMGMIGKTILTVLRDNVEESEVLSLGPQLPAPLTEYRMHRMFLDPLGNHLIVSVLHNDQHQGENFYIYIGGGIGSKKTISKVLRGHVVTAVAFNPDNKQNTSTGPILLATSKGLVFETELSAPNDGDWRFGSKSTASEKYSKKIHQMREEVSITGIHLELVSSPIGGQTQAVVFISTPRCLYTFFGPTVATVDLQPVFEKVFAPASKSWAYNHGRELPNPSKKSLLCVLKPKRCPTAIHAACLFGPVGVYHGDLETTTEFSGTIESSPWLRFSEEPQTLQFCSSRQNETSVLEQPAAMVLSKYHVLVLFGDKLRVYNQLDHSLVMEDRFPQGGMIGLVRDPTTGSIWIYSQKEVFRYKVVEENRHMWRVLLAKKRYDQALLFCKNDPLKLDKVWFRQAQDLFSEGLYEEAALKFSDTFSSFEEVSLRFLEVDQQSALRLLLKQKLDRLAESAAPGQDNTNRAQLTMIATWLIQLYLNRLGHLKHLASKKDAGGSQAAADLQTAENELRSLLTNEAVRDVIQRNQKSFYKLIANHGDEDLLLEFSEMMQDFAHVIQQHIQNERYEKALKVLRSQRNPDLYYRFSPELMAHLPEQLVDCWISESNKLDPVKLIPSFVQLKSTKSSDLDFGLDGLTTIEDTFDPRAPHILHSIRYLEYCVEKRAGRDEAIHNYLIALYARLNDTTKLLQYLTSQGDYLSMVHYDAKFALRVFSKLALHEASIHVYGVMGLYSEALELALQQLKDVELAENIANRPENEEERKKLWLVIAEYVISKGEDIGKAMDLLSKCELLRIEDILPFFPEFECIDHFKDAICNSLQSYKSQICALRESMAAATKATDQIRTETVEVRNRCYVVNCAHKCDVCGFALLSQAFFVFPCLHRFHSQCLQDSVRKMPPFSMNGGPSSGALDRDGSSGDQIRLEVPSRGSSVAPTGAGTAIKGSIDDICAQECLYCGELIADSIGVPFFGEEEYELEHQKWI